MNVFILCSGRTGSVSFIKACEHISNFSADHESKAKDFSASKFKYPDQHIEADNRLSWFLGHLDKAYGDSAYYVVLKRDKAETVASFGKRWNNRGSIIAAFKSGILMLGDRTTDGSESSGICELYYDTVYNNIDLFLKDKTKVLRIDLENIKDDFARFWEWIGAEGDMKASLKEFEQKHNSSKKSKWFNW